MRQGDEEKGALRALVEGPEWARMGTNGAVASATVNLLDAPETQEKPAGAGLS
jgi:hypothetical protein